MENVLAELRSDKKAFQECIKIWKKWNKWKEKWKEVLWKAE